MLYVPHVFLYDKIGKIRGFKKAFIPYMTNKIFVMAPLRLLSTQKIIPSEALMELGSMHSFNRDRTLYQDANAIRKLLAMETGFQSDSLQCASNKIWQALVA